MVKKLYGHEDYVGSQPKKHKYPQQKIGRNAKSHITECNGWAELEDFEKNGLGCDCIHESIPDGEG